MLDVLLYVSSGLILFSYICYFIILFVGRKINISNINGFDLTKEIISEYDIINVIESKNYLTLYNIKRKVIKLATNCYYGKDISSISLSLVEAAISVIDKLGNKYINLFRNIFSNLKILYIFPIIAVFINHVSFNVSDAKISMVFIVIISLITYMLIDIKNYAKEWIDNNLKKIRDIGKEKYIKIINFIDKILWLDKFVFFGELIMIIRFVAILLEL